MGLLALFRRRPLERPGFMLYTAAVTAARDPWFFGEAVGVPDTLDGRFDLVGLHAAVLIRRLHRDPDPRGAEAGPSGLRRHVRRHGREPAGDGRRRHVRGQAREAHVGSLPRPRPGLRGRARCRGPRGAGSRARPQRLARRPGPAAVGRRRGPGRPGGAHRPRPWRRSPSPPCCAARSSFLQLRAGPRPPMPPEPAPEFSRPLPLGLVGPEGRREVAGGRRSGARGARPPLRHPRRRELPGRAAPAAGRGWRRARRRPPVGRGGPDLRGDARAGGATRSTRRWRSASCRKGASRRTNRTRRTRSPPGTGSPISAKRWRNSSPSHSIPTLARPMRSCPRTPPPCPPPPGIPWRRWPSSAAAGVIEGRAPLARRRRRW